MLEEIRKEDYRLLRHYPSPWDLIAAHRGAPDWWGPVSHRACGPCPSAMEPSRAAAHRDVAASAVTLGTRLATPNGALPSISTFQ